MSTQIYTSYLTGIHCDRCSVAFGIPAEFNAERLAARRSFWCPNGHSPHYLGKTELEKERERAEWAEKRLKWAEARETAVRDQKEATERSLAATKGHLTRQRKRAAHGVCPCCKRTFADLARHVAGQHPAYLEANR